jgi:hypothetical protein
MARYDWLVDFGDAAPQIPSRYQQPTPAGGLHRHLMHLIRPVIADDLPAGASFGVCALQPSFSRYWECLANRWLAAHAIPNISRLVRDIYLMLQCRVRPMSTMVAMGGPMGGKS